MMYRLVGSTVATVLLTATLHAQTIETAIDDFRRGRMEECIISLNDLVAQKALSQEQQITAYKYLSLASRGLDKKNEAAFYLQQLAATAPEADLSAERFPEDLLATWWKVKRAVASDTNLPQTRTIAFLHFDNASIEEADKWQPMTVGMPAMLAGDFLDLNVLKVVERAKIEAILSELKLSEQQYSDPNTAVRLGRLAGAHVLVFGTLMQLDSRTMRVDARLVQTETGELLAAVKVEGRPGDIVALERELVEKLAERLELKLEESSRAKIKGPDGPPLEATLAYYNGILYEDQGNYADAYESYKKAAELYPPYEAAKQKLATLTPFVQAG
jgi:TolB-like protein